MRVLCLVLFGLLLFRISPVQADSVTELKILEESFSFKGGEGSSLATGAPRLAESLRQSLVGLSLPESAVRTFRLLAEDETSAVYEAVVEDQGVARIWSAFFRRTPLGSQLDALRTLNLPPYLADVEYQRLLAAKDLNSWQRGRLLQLQRLFMATESLKEEFKKHKSAFDALAKEVEKGESASLDNAVRENALVGLRPYGVKRSEGEIALQAAQAKEGRKNGEGQLGSEFGLGGFMDSLLGLLHLPPGVTPPLMSKKDYILVEDLGENWYLFRNIAAEPFNDKGTKSGK